MRILFDQGTPAPLRRFLKDHVVSTAHEMGWSGLENGDLILAAERQFDVLITTDKNLRYQQNLSARRVAIFVLPTTSWPKLRLQTIKIAAAVNQLAPGEYREFA